MSPYEEQLASRQTKVAVIAQPPLNKTRLTLIIFATFLLLATALFIWTARLQSPVFQKYSRAALGLPPVFKDSLAETSMDSKSLVSPGTGLGATLPPE